MKKDQSSLTTAGIAIAIALVTAYWVFVAFGIVNVAGLFSRVPREERVMLEEFGAEFTAYMQRTGRFLTRVSRPGR